jgi:hypothetical protein
MARLMSPAFYLLICIASLGVARADDTFRCGSKIIAVGMTRTAVLTSCGEPTSKTEEAVPVRSGNQVVGTTTMHRWTYESYSATRVLVFDADKLVSIQ